MLEKKEEVNFCPIYNIGFTSEETYRGEEHFCPRFGENISLIEIETQKDDWKSLLFSPEIPEFSLVIPKDMKSNEKFPMNSALRFRFKTYLILGLIIIIGTFFVPFFLALFKVFPNITTEGPGYPVITNSIFIIFIIISLLSLLIIGFILFFISSEVLKNSYKINEFKL
ncbi:hypothetical protein AYK25_08385 [Thermoplasmatales archaeon SM1-50]|nr:MAG: hypothetical protein AYK25_08385 [Thermoplasmatales archaeon SM1-50]